MEIKTRKRKKKKADDIVHRHLNIVGYRGPGAYCYDVTENTLRKVTSQDPIRFYQDEGSYIEVALHKGYLVLRAGGIGLRLLLLKGQASNVLEVKSVLNKLDKDGESKSWE